MNPQYHLPHISNSAAINLHELKHIHHSTALLIDLILELFLNILAKRGKYIIFALDEMENMYNISPKRLSLFLTTYRDLIDMFNKIKGHVLVCAITEAVRLEVVNEPFYSRVSNDIVDLFQLTSDQDILDLMKYLQSDILVECHCDESELTNMATAVGGTQRISPLPTRELVRVIVSKMKKQRHFEGLKSYLASNTQLQSLYNETMSIMEKDGSPGIVAKSFFDPLSYYLVATGLSEEKPEIENAVDTTKSIEAYEQTTGEKRDKKNEIQDNTLTNNRFMKEMLNIKVDNSKTENNARQHTGDELEKIDLADIRKLTATNWHYANNSFVIHGFMNYKYLIVMTEGDKRYLGVPGVYEKPEAMMAKLFGFSDFIDEKTHTRMMSEGAFGYWLSQPL